MSDEKIINASIVEEMQSAYIDYSMSVLVSRALPDIRDGLKPVHRRILYCMHVLNMTYNKAYKKAARVVGDVLGKYHPHGDTAIYESMVRMAQHWSLRYTLVDGQGNFGSIDGDGPASMRYTEVRMQKVAEEMLIDIEKNTVDFSPNFDGSLLEPCVLPSRLPNLLVNGVSGIAVGMATNMAPHNLSEVVDGIIAYIDCENITVEGLITHIKAPDFPTGGIICGYDQIKEAYTTGKGKITVRARYEIEMIANKEQIVVTEIPYIVNKAALIERTAQLVNDKIIDGISNIRDESDREGMRIVYEIKKDFSANLVINNLFKYTALQSTFSINNVALVNGKPEMVNLITLIRNFVDHRHEVLLRKTRYEFDQSKKRLHILEGYIVALDNLEDIIELIKNSKDTASAHLALMNNYKLSDIQTKAILEMRLQKITGLEREKISKEYNDIKIQIEEIQKLLADKALRMNFIKNDLISLKNAYGDRRRTSIQPNADDISVEDVIADEPMVITISDKNYIKRTSLQEYKLQNRGGIGSQSAGGIKQEDFPKNIFIANTHNYLLIFTALGKVFWKKVYELPFSSKTARGRALQNLIDIAQNDSVKSVVAIKTLLDKDYLINNHIVMCTTRGLIKKTSLEAYSNIRSNGINAIKINDGDELLDVKLVNGGDHIVIALESGRAIRFSEKEIRPMGRVTMGVRGISVDPSKDIVVGLVVISSNNTDLLVISENGYGKRSSIDDYRITKRGGKGIITMNITNKTGKLVAIKSVKNEDELMIIKKSGVSIRIKISDLRVIGRATQGVKVITLQKDDTIASVAKINSFIVSCNSDELINR